MINNSKFSIFETSLPPHRPWFRCMSQTLNGFFSIHYSFMLEATWLVLPVWGPVKRRYKDLNLRRISPSLLLISRSFCYSLNRQDKNPLYIVHDWGRHGAVLLNKMSVQTSRWVYSCIYTCISGKPSHTDSALNEASVISARQDELCNSF